jgi:site-specific recombinase XerD
VDQTVPTGTSGCRTKSGSQHSAKLSRHIAPSSPQLATKLRKPIDLLEVENLSANVVRCFLSDIEKKRSCSISTRNQRLSAITIRHTTATHLLRAGVDINTIRAWLGHVSVGTTNIYAEVDLEMKAKALAACDMGGEKPSRKMWRTEARVMEFLRDL